MDEFLSASVRISGDQPVRSVALRTRCSETSVFLFTSTFARLVSSYATIHVVHVLRRTTFSPHFPRAPDPDIWWTVGRRGGPVSWPARSTGLKIMDFWLWIILKTLAY